MPRRVWRRDRDAPDDEGDDEVAASVASGAEDAVEADLAQRAQRCGDMAVRQRAGDGDGVALGGDDGAAFEHAPQALDLGKRPVGEVAQRAFADLTVLAVALAQEDGWR